MNSNIYRHEDEGFFSEKLNLHDVHVIVFMLHVMDKDKKKLFSLKSLNKRNTKLM